MASRKSSVVFLRPAGLEWSGPVALRQRIVEIYEDHHEALRSFLRRSLSTDSEVEEFVQDVYVRLLRLDSLDMLKQNPRAYIFQIGKNLIRDHFRKRSNRALHHTYDPAREPEGNDPGPHENLTWQQRLECLKQAIEDLPEPVRTAFLMHRVRGKAHQEIADELGVSKRTVRRHVAGALTYLHTRLENMDEISG